MELLARGAVSHRVAPNAPDSVTIICMSRSLKKLVLAVALLVVPLQGVAATLSPLFCHDEGQEHAMHSIGGHDRGVHQGSLQGEGGTGGSSAHHPCCNHSVSAPPVATLSAGLPDFPVLAFSPDPIRALFVPERPPRPPLA